MTAVTGLPSTRRSAIVAVAVLGALVLLAIVARPGPGRFDIESKELEGYFGIAAILEELGVVVEERSFADGFGDADVVVFVDAERMGDDQLDSVDGLADSAARLVFLGAPPALGRTDLFDGPMPAECSVEEFAAYQPPGFPFEAPFEVSVEPLSDGWATCFGDSSGAAVAIRSLETRDEVLVASPWLATNGALGPDSLFDGTGVGNGEPWPENGPLLLASILGTGNDCGAECSVVFVRGGLVGAQPRVASDEGFVDLLPARGVAIAVQLGMAAAAYVMLRMRRHGRVLVEPDAVTVEASELVAATGRLHATGRHHGRASVRLRNAACDELSSLLGVTLADGLEELIKATARHTGRDIADVRSALGGLPARSDEELAALDAALHELRTEVRGDPTL